VTVTVTVGELTGLEIGVGVEELPTGLGVRVAVAGVLRVAVAVGGEPFVLVGDADGVLVAVACVAAVTVGERAGVRLGVELALLEGEAVAV
jgi:hypothetical protein